MKMNYHLCYLNICIVQLSYIAVHELVNSLTFFFYNRCRAYVVTTSPPSLLVNLCAMLTKLKTIDGVLLLNFLLCIDMLVILAFFYVVLHF